MFIYNPVISAPSQL